MANVQINVNDLENLNEEEFLLLYNVRGPRNTHSNLPPMAVLEKIHGGGGMGESGLELPGTICELKCYKPKLLNIFSNYKPSVFQM